MLGDPLVEAELVNCLIHDNEAHQATQSETGHGGGIFAQYNATIEVINTTITRNCAKDGGSGIELSCTWRGGVSCVRNSLIWNNFDPVGINQIRVGLPAECSDEGDLVVSYCSVGPGSTDLTISGPISNITLEDVVVCRPRFLDPSNGDFRLALTSPVVDLGNPDAGPNVIPFDQFDLNGNEIVNEPTPDLDLEDRVQAGTVDLGAYEGAGSVDPACLADIAGTPPDPCENGPMPDGEVDVQDLLYLLSVWGLPDPYADLSPPCGDGDVDTADLLFLLANWDCGGGVSPPGTIIDCLQQYTDPEEQSGCIEMLIKSGQL